MQASAGSAQAGDRILCNCKLRFTRAPLQARFLPIFRRYSGFIRTGVDCPADVQNLFEFCKDAGERPARKIATSRSSSASPPLESTGTGLCPVMPSADWADADVRRLCLAGMCRSTCSSLHIGAVARVVTWSDGARPLNLRGGGKFKCLSSIKVVVQ
jgi:hypothetical protein